MKHSTVAIIGAGPAGLVSAFIFAKAGYKVDVYDAGKSVGGLSLSFKLWGKTVELGPHFFEFISEPEVKSIIYDPYKSGYVLYDRNTKILLNGLLLKYPPNPFDIIYKLKFISLIKIGLSAIKAKFRNKALARTAEELSINTTGRFAHDMFIKDYCEKIWGIPCKNISTVFLTRLLGYSEAALPFPSLIKKILFSKKTTYTHPVDGLTIVWEKLAQLIEGMGGDIHLSQVLKNLIINENNTVTGIELQGGEIKRHDHTLVTLPVSAIASIIPGKEDKINSIMSSVKYRSVVSVYVEVRGVSTFSEQCIFLYSKDVRATKITNFSNFPRRNDDSNSYVILFEYWCSYDDEIWRADREELVSIIKKDAYMLHEIMPGFEVNNIEVKRLKDIYPVPDVDYYNKINAVNDIFQTYSNLSYVGRGASGHFNYSTTESMVDSIALSKKLVRRRC